MGILWELSVIAQEELQSSTFIKLTSKQMPLYCGIQSQHSDIFPSINRYKLACSTSKHFLGIGAVRAADVEEGGLTCCFCSPTLQPPSPCSLQDETVRGQLQLFGASQPGHLWGSILWKGQGENLRADLKHGIICSPFLAAFASR